MYPDDIQTYTSREQFEAHLKMLAEMKEHFEQTGASLATFEKIRKEEKKLDRWYKKWKNKEDKREKVPVRYLKISV